MNRNKRIYTLIRNPNSLIDKEKALQNARLFLCSPSRTKVAALGIYYLIVVESTLINENFVINNFVN
jgi:hypothetical protein